MKRLRRVVSWAASLVLAVGAISVIAPAAEAASYPVRPFTVKYGNTYTTGHVTFYNRSVLLEYAVTSVANDDCRFTRTSTYDKIELHETARSEKVCGTTEYFSYNQNASNKGGAEYVLVELVAGPFGANEGKVLGRVKVYRN